MPKKCLLCWVLSMLLMSGCENNTTQELVVDTSLCGNGMVELGEMCDDGNNLPDDGCSPDCSSIEFGFTCPKDGGSCVENTSSDIPDDELTVECGDAHVDESEFCDDGNSQDGDGCSSDCTVEEGYACDSSEGTSVCKLLSYCGDGRVDESEFCDDGNTESGDGCSSDCTVEEGFECDSSEGVTVCKPLPLCGDGRIDDDEYCDDGNTEDGDGCSSECMIEEGYECDSSEGTSLCKIKSYCGDGVLDESEVCDDGNNQSGDGCSAECAALEEGFDCTQQEGKTICVVKEYCGDGIINNDEKCDDGNTISDDGCSSDCKTIEKDYSCPEAGVPCIHKECGNGKKEGKEVCDDGAKNVEYASGPGKCSTSCNNAPYCGDGKLDKKHEKCDDANTKDGDGCSKKCAIETGWSCDSTGKNCDTNCGDGILAGTEKCDDANTKDGDGCSKKCEIENGWSCDKTGKNCHTNCGDGILAGTETCDDGNTTDGDGCSKKCAIETGWSCDSTGKNCKTICGDGFLAGTEKCDDGNKVGGDGCSAKCEIECYWSCDTVGKPCTKCEIKNEMTAKEIEILKETADAYYNRSKSIQYSGPDGRRNIWLKPEDATEQDYAYLDCSGFVHAVYYEAFGIELPIRTHEFTSLAYTFFNKEQKEIIKTYEKEELQNKLKNDYNNFIKELAGMVKIGDIMTWKNKNGGHSFLVYDIESDHTDVTIMHVNEKKWNKWIKLRDGLNWDAGDDEHGGAVYKDSLSKLLRYADKAVYFSIYRPIIAQRDDNGSCYKKASCEYDSNLDYNNKPNDYFFSYKCDVTNSSYTIPKASFTRKDNKGLQITLTSKPADGSVVKNDTIYYTLELKNASKKELNLDKTVNFSLNGGGTNDSKPSDWKINQSIAAGKSIKHEFSVKANAKNNTSIALTGTIGGISIGTVKHSVHSQDSITEDELAIAYHKVVNSSSKPTGLKLIDNIYKELGYGCVNLDGIVVGGQKEGNQCNPYVKSDKYSKALIQTENDLKSKTSVKLNTTYEALKDIKDMVLDGHYGALCNSYSCDSCDKCTITSYERSFYGPAGKTTNREEYILADRLKTGDVLIYENRNDLTNEEGVYAFIYFGKETPIPDSNGKFNKGFHGRNFLKNEGKQDYIYVTEGPRGGTDDKGHGLFYLYDKDYYAILRPSLVCKK